MPVAMTPQLKWWQLEEDDDEGRSQCPRDSYCETDKLYYCLVNASVNVKYYVAVLTNVSRR